MRPAAAHAATWRHASPRTQRPIGRIEPCSSAISMKSPGGDEAALRVLPADERLDAREPARLEVDDRLVAEVQLVELDRLLELHRELVPVADGLVHARVEDLEPRLAARLRHVHRHVGVADHVGRPLDRVAGPGDADARGDRDRLAGDVVRRAELADEPLGHRPRPAQVRQVLGQDRELVAAQAGDDVAFADQPGDAVRDGDQELVARGVAHGVVDDLEVVEVDEQHGRDPVASATRWRR